MFLLGLERESSLDASGPGRGQVDEHVGVDPLVLAPWESLSRDTLLALFLLISKTCVKLELFSQAFNSTTL